MGVSDAKRYGKVFLPANLVSLTLSESLCRFDCIHCTCLHQSKLVCCNCILSKSDLLHRKDSVCFPPFVEEICFINRDVQIYVLLGAPKIDRSYKQEKLTTITEDSKNLKEKRKRGLRVIRYKAQSNGLFWLAGWCSPCWSLQLGLWRVFLQSRCLDD